MNYPDQADEVGVGVFPGCCVSSFLPTGKVNPGNYANIAIFDSDDPEVKVYEEDPQYTVTRGDSMTIVSGNPQFPEKKRFKKQWDEHYRLQEQDGREEHEFKVGDNVFSPYYDGYASPNYFRRVLEVNEGLVGLSVQFVKNAHLPPNPVVDARVAKELVLRMAL